MIQYTTGEWNVRFLFAVKGSALPKAVAWAVPATANAIIVHLLFHVWSVLPHWQAVAGVGAIWSSFTFVLGFLLVFRTQSAYSRYWEGANLVQQSRANLFNACSSVIAFCSVERGRAKRVEEFQHLLVRLISMLQCVGLQTIAEMSDVKFEFFNTEGMDPESMKFLSRHTDRQQRCEIIIQWIQRLVVEGSRNGIIDVPAPILTRFFQELSLGASHIINARIITGIPFPFPYAQLLTTLLIAHWLFTPWFCALVMQSATLSSIFTFISIIAFWGANYIAAEIESPFGDDDNDLPLHSLQKDMNKSLWILLHPHTQAVPGFKFDPATHRKWDVVTKTTFNRASEHHSAVYFAGPTKIWTRFSGNRSATRALDAGQDELPLVSVASLSEKLSSHGRRPVSGESFSSDQHLPDPRMIGRSNSRLVLSISESSDGGSSVASNKLCMEMPLPQGSNGEARGHHCESGIELSQTPRLPAFGHRHDPSQTLLHLSPSDGEVSDRPLQDSPSQAGRIRRWNSGTGEYQRDADARV